MGPRPENEATPRALKKRLVLLPDKGRDEGCGVIVRDRCEGDVAICATIVPLSIHVEIDLEVLIELAQLSFDHIACKQGVTTAEELAEHQASIAREQPSVFAERALDQYLVGDGLFIRCVVTENTEPARKAAEHGIGHETRRQMASLVIPIHEESVL
jgi:hypothetical protein